MANKIKNNGILLTVFLAVVCGLAAGICGEAIMRVYFLDDYSSPYSSQEVDLASLNNLDSSRSSLIIRDPKKVVVNQDVKIEETINSVSSARVGVFKEIKTKTSTEKLKSDYYSLLSPLFSGLVITSDGWVMSSLPGEIKDDFIAKGAIKEYIAVASDRKTYKIDQVVAINNLSGDIVFFHLAAASNLPVQKIAARSELSLGQSLLVINNDNDVWPTTLSSFRKTPEVMNSDTIDARISLAYNSDAYQKNSLVFDLSGSLAAVIGHDQEVVPAFAFTSYWQNFLKKGTVAGPFLGINYLDLSSVKIPDVNMSKGALIYPNGNKAAVVKGSPAAAAGLEAGDIITWINNQEINSSNDLADVIAKYAPGDKITIIYQRAGQEKGVDVKLGTAE